MLAHLNLDLAQTDWVTRTVGTTPLFRRCEYSKSCLALPVECLQATTATLSTSCAFVYVRMEFGRGELRLNSAGLVTQRVGAWLDLKGKRSERWKTTGSNGSGEAKVV